MRYHYTVISYAEMRMLINAMDRTEDFKQALKSARKTERVLNSEGGPAKTLNLQSRQKRNSEFNTKAKEIVQSITGLRDFLLKHRTAYINSHQVVWLPSVTMSDYERDKIDEEAQNIVKKCKEAVSVMQQKFLQDALSEQVQTHRSLVLTLIQNYLKSVCKIYSEQRAIRVKLVVDKKRISRLHNPEMHKKQSASQEDAGSSGITTAEKPEKPSPLVQNKYAYDESDDDLSEEDEVTLQQENALLFNDMNSMVDEVRAIEGKVVEIARLQEIFSEQVLQQEGDINLISEKVVESTENIKDGNEEIREAIKNNAGFRVWILFFLVMCSFSLLFLEWYS